MNQSTNQQCTGCNDPLARATVDGVFCDSCGDLPEYQQLSAETKKNIKMAKGFAKHLDSALKRNDWKLVATVASGLRNLSRLELEFPTEPEGLQRESGSGGICKNEGCSDFGEFVPTFRYGRNDLWSCDTCGGQEVG